MLRAAVANDRTVESAAAQCKPDMTLVLAVDGIGLGVLRRALLGQTPVVVVMGDTWLAQAWSDPARFDPVIGFLRGRASHRALGWFKRAAGRVAGLGRLGVDIFPSVPAVMAISEFLIEQLALAGFPVHSGALCERIPVPIGPPFFDTGGAPAGCRRTLPVSGPLRALTVGRLEPLKGYRDAIRAVAEACKGGADVTLTIAGMDHAGHSTEIRGQIAASGCADRMELIVDAGAACLFDLYMTHDVFLFPSRIVEGFGIVCAEAMACGLPVIATTPGGQDDLVRDDETGFRFIKGDTAVLARLLSELAADRRKAGRLSAGALRAVRQYHEPRSLESVDSFLKGVVTPAPCRANGRDGARRSGRQP
jgi:glycosyltransferase involved in cell wall biosynthesis